MKEFSYIITDRDGIHARPAGLLANMATGVKSNVTIAKGEKEANAKRIFAIMGLSVKCNDKITVTCTGPDETIAVKQIEDFVKNNL